MLHAGRTVSMVPIVIDRGKLVGGGLGRDVKNEVHVLCTDRLLTRDHRPYS